MPFLVPEHLVAGSTVAVVAPSGPVVPERLARGVATLEAWGLNVIVMPNALTNAHVGILAGTDEQRAQDFVDAMSLPDVSAVLCARGGHGATRIIDEIDWGRIACATPRWLVGSSDVTALHQSVHARLGWATLHGAMVASEVFAGDAPDLNTVESLRHALLRPWGGLDAPEDVAFALHQGRASGRLVGGNLALLCATLGTSDSNGASHGIALLEDVAESPYRIDRMLTQLLRTGWFEGVRGVALGTFYQCGDVVPVLQDRLGRLGVPVLGGLPVGHGPRQLTLPLGVVASLDTHHRTLSLATTRN